MLFQVKSTYIESLLNEERRKYILRITTKWISLEIVLFSIYKFDANCHGFIPQGDHFLWGLYPRCYLLSGDSDTIVALAGSIAETYYGVDETNSREESAYIAKLLS